MDLAKADEEDLLSEGLKGIPEAQFELGVRHAHGQGMPQDFAAAVHWFKLAAAQGHSGAQDSLGVRCATGQGVPKDDQQAVEWFRKAALQNHAVAQFNLGLACAHGQGVPQDLPRGLRLVLPQRPPGRSNRRRRAGPHR